MTRETCFSCWPKKSKTNTKQYPVSSCLEYWRNIVLYIPVTLCNLILSKAHSVSSFPYRQLTELYINTVVRRVQVHLLLHTCDCLYRIKHFVSLDHSECALFFLYNESKPTVKWVTESDHPSHQYLANTERWYDLTFKSFHWKLRESMTSGQSWLIIMMTTNRVNFSNDSQRLWLARGLTNNKGNKFIFDLWE